MPLNLFRRADMDPDPDDSDPDAPGVVTPDILHGFIQYPKFLWALVGTVIACAALLHLTTTVWAHFKVMRLRYNRNRRRSEMGFGPGSGTLSRGDQPVGSSTYSIRRLPQAMLIATRVIWLRCTLPIPAWMRPFWGNGMTPNLLEALITLAYLLTLLTWEFVHSNNFDPEYWSDRAAHLAASQIPLLPALSAKNNIIGWLTGVSHEKLNLIHRGVARCILVLIWIHFWGRFHLGFTDEDNLSMIRWQRYGAAAGLTFTIIVALSVRPIRTRVYEFFFYTHVVLVAAFMVLSFLHTRGRGYEYYIWPAWIVWVFDRACRGIRHLYLDWWARPKDGPSTATVELLTNDSMRLSVRRRLPAGWRAGQHMFVTLPTVSRYPLEAHPFTISSSPAEQREGKERTDDELVFIIRGRGGMTKRLQSLAIKHGKVDLPVYLDGPYGNPPDLTPYTTSILIAGGSGISYILPLFRELVRQVESRRACTRRMVFIWTLRQEAHLQWIMEHLTGALASVPEFLSLDALEVGIYVTGSSRPGGGSSSSAAGDRIELSDFKRARNGKTISVSSTRSSGDRDLELGGDFELPGGLTVRRGRPDIRAILEDEISVAEGPVSVNVSGPASLVEDTRAALASPVAGPTGVLKGLPTIYFHAENYTL